MQPPSIVAELSKEREMKETSQPHGFFFFFFSADHEVPLTAKQIIVSEALPG